MKYLILIMALISAFFVSADDSIYDAYDLNTLKSPKTDTKLQCSYQSKSYNVKIAEDASSCVDWAANIYKNDYSKCGFELGNIQQQDSSIIQQVVFWKTADGAGSCIYKQQSSITVNLLPIAGDPSCPPDNAPLHEHMITYPQDSDTKYCAKLKDEPENDEPDPDCPEPTDSDPFVFGTGGSTSVCFPADNGRQCEIKTDENGGYYIPISYGSTEPTACVPDPDPEPEEPEEPENPDNPDKTPAPDEPDAPKDGDNSDKNNEIDALNQVNDNLKIINDSINREEESHRQRLDRIAKETQNSNELLATIKENTLNTYKGTIDTQEVIRDQIKETVKTTTQVEGVKLGVEGVKTGVQGVKTATEGVKTSTEGVRTEVVKTNDLQSQILDELKKQNNTTVESTFDPTKSKSFYESEYEEGFEGVWNEKSLEFEQTETFKFLDQFKFNSGGQAPNTQICFNLGSNMDFGCSDLPTPSAQLLAILKIFILITAAFLCRALIFGG